MTSQIKTRTKKNQKIDFLKWYLSNDDLNETSGNKLSLRYKSLTDIYVSPAFINRNRKLYCIFNGEIVLKSIRDKFITEEK